MIGAGMGPMAEQFLGRRRRSTRRWRRTFQDPRWNLPSHCTPKNASETPPSADIRTIRAKAHAASRGARVRHGRARAGASSCPAGAPQPVIAPERALSPATGIDRRKAGNVPGSCGFSSNSKPRRVAGRTHQREHGCARGCSLLHQRRGDTLARPQSRQQRTKEIVARKGPSMTIGERDSTASSASDVISAV